MATIGALAFSAMAAFAFKALITAKIAALISAVLLFGKFFHYKYQPQSKEVIALEPPPDTLPEFIEIPISGNRHDFSFLLLCEKFQTWNFIPAIPPIMQYMLYPEMQVLQKLRVINKWPNRK